MTITLQDPAWTQAEAPDHDAETGCAHCNSLDHETEECGFGLDPYDEGVFAEGFTDPDEPEWAVLLCWIFVALTGAYLLYQGAAFAFEALARGGWR